MFPCLQSSLLQLLLQSAPNITEKVGGTGNAGSSGGTILGSIGENLTGSGKVGTFAVLGTKFKSALFTTFGFIAAFNSISTIGSGTGILLAIP